MQKILILSPYDGLSHRYWRVCLSQYLRSTQIDIELTEIGLPARFFSWRQRGNSLTFAMDSRLQASFDLIIATSMTDLSALRGLNRHLSDTPALVFFHENQFAYPGENTLGLIERQLTSIYTALSGDWLFFNSQFNLDTLLEGAQLLLRKMPDGVPPNLIDLIRAKSSVVPVAIEVPNEIRIGLQKTRESTDGVRKIVWNHRWEHDKGPALLLDIVQKLIAQGSPFKLSLLGEQFDRAPAAFEQIQTLLESAGALGVTGFIPNRQDYLQTLAEHDVVLSTALQEFQGLAIQEAILCGCIPVVPDRLSYPEYIPEAFRYESADDAVRVLLQGRKDPGLSLSRYGWDEVGPMWLQHISRLCPSD